MVLTILGILSSIIFLIGDLPYFIDTLRGKTKPQRVTWGIFCALNTIGFANQLASGADNSLWLFGAGVVATGAIFIASLFRGVGGYARMDAYVMLVALAGVGLWLLFDSPELSIVVSALVAGASMVPTFAKAKKHPETETRLAWLLGALSACLAAVSVGALDWRLLLLPVNATILQAYMVYILYIKAKKRANTQQSEARLL